MAEYNPFQDLNPRFSYYTSPFINYTNSSFTESKNSVIKDDLFGDIDLPGYEVGKDGNILAPANTPKAQEYNYNNLMNEMAATHGEQRQYVQEQSPTTQKSTTKQDLKGNKKKAMEFFQSKGLSPYQAAGIVGNFIGESNLDPNAVNPSSGAFGLAQWLGSRKKKLISKYGKNPTFDQQLEFAWEELNGDEKFALNKLLQTQSVDEAVNSFMQHFERPSKREMAQSIGNRLKYGRDLLL